MLEFTEIKKEQILDVNLLDLIYRSKTTGIIVKDFLSIEKRQELIQYLDSLVKLSTIDKYLTYPWSFKDTDISGNYQGSPSMFFKNSPALTGVLNDLKEVFSKISMGSKVNIPEDYLPCTFRVIHPEQCHIDLHCGNQFFHQFAETYKNLVTSVNVQDQMSFFTLVQKPDDGGYLEVYDARWDTYKSCNLSNQTLISKEGVELELQDAAVQKKLVPVEEGDLLIFQGGQFWHKVTQVYGKKHRITFGGFIGQGLHDQSVSFWS